MTFSRVFGLFSAIAILITLAVTPSQAKGHSGGKSREGKACTYQKCVDKCVARLGVGQFSDAKCSQKCVKRGCT